jgi:hypothetical protein
MIPRTTSVSATGPWAHCSLPSALRKCRGRLVGPTGSGRSTWRQLCAFGSVADRGYDPGMPLDDDVHRDSAWGTSSVGAHHRGRRLARYVEPAAVKPSSSGATFVFESDLHEHAALLILNRALEQGRWRRSWWPRSTHTRGSGEQGSRCPYDPRLHRGGYAPRRDA